MNKRYLPAITIGIAVLIIGSVTFAADRRRNTKNADLPANKYLEDEALRTELLEAVEHKAEKESDSDDAKKVAAVGSVNKDAEHTKAENK